MITPFGFRHIWLMRELQSATIELDLESALLEEPSSPLRAALQGYFLKSRAGVVTYVLRTPDRAKSLCGFVQVRAQRPAVPWVGNKPGPAWRIVRIAPVLDHSEDAATIWYRLLLHLCIAAGERQVQRLIARMPEGSAAEDVFRQASFVPYCHERVYRRLPHHTDRETSPRQTEGDTSPRQTHGDTSAGENADSLSPRIRPMQSEDCLDVRRLWHRVTPRPVQQAEEFDNPRGSSLPFEALFSNAEQSCLLRSPDGEAWGYLHILLRPRGVWLRMVMHPDARDCTAGILDHALAMLEYHTLPTYCAVREYEGGTQSVLEARGFAPVDSYSLLVKHTTVRVREPRRKLVPALEKRVEVAPTVSRSEAADR